jgi:hypothetical protein
MVKAAHLPCHPHEKWIDTARDVKLWNDIIDQWHEIACQLSFTIISDTLE